MAPTSFNGPWAQSLEDFKKSLASMPPQYHAAFDLVSQESRAAICNKEYLHVWESDSDIDSLLQLTQVIIKLSNMTTYVPQAGSSAGKNVSSGMLIIAQVTKGRDNFERICSLVHYLTNEDGRPHMNNTVMTYGGIKVVKGIDNTRPLSSSGKDTSKGNDTQARDAVERINKTISRIFHKYNPSRKIIWHNGPVLHFLLFWINNTTHSLRSSLAGITIHSLFTLTNTSITLSAFGNSNKPNDLTRLQEYCTKLNIIAVFLDTHSQEIVHPYLTVYMYFYAFYINTLLPPAVLRPHRYLAQDHLVSYCFQLRAAADKPLSNNPAAVVKQVQSHLRPALAKPWAKTCINPQTYANRKLCQTAALDANIHHAVQLADAPFEQFTSVASGNRLAAFSRLTIGPAAELVAGHYVCVPVGISPTTSAAYANWDSWDPKPAAQGSNQSFAFQIRPLSPSPFRLYLPSTSPNPSPTTGSTADIVTQRIQGIMIAVLDLVRARKGMPTFNSSANCEERQMWDEVVKACTWALEGCDGKLPRGVEDKVRFVKEKLKTGTWAWCLGVGMGAAPGVGGGAGAGWGL